MAASLASPWDVSNLAWRAGMSPVELRRLILAWKARGTRDLTAVARMRVTHVTPEVVPVFEQLSLLDTRLDE